MLVINIAIVAPFIKKHLKNQKTFKNKTTSKTESFKIKDR